MALIFPMNCNLNTKSSQNFNFNSSYQSHNHSVRVIQGKHQLPNQCFKVTNELDDDSFRTNSKDDEEEGLGVKAALSMLKFYKREISPFLPKSCRYVPTCSEYSMIAYKKYGVAKGTVLTAWRLCRCNPLGGSGFDPPRWFDEPRPSDE